MNETIRSWMQAHETDVRALAREIFHTPELAEQEVRSADALCRFMQAQGFRVERGAAGLPTAFRAVYGSGAPVIAFLAEYDALPELGQEPVPYRAPVSGNGHGCGHNLLGTGCAAAAAAAAQDLRASGLPGTVVLFGCPAEEACYGKYAMAKAGCFDGVDIAVSWHPSDRNQVSEESFQALVSRKFFYHGVSAHAAACPERGRSALDAAELTNVAVNYLREHVPEHVRMHYVYTSAGEKPNVVPDHAGLWYFVRARDAETVRDADARVILAAQGAAMATQTTVETQKLTFSPETRINHTLCRAMKAVFDELGAAKFTPEEHAFGEALRRALALPENGPALREDILPLTGEVRHVTGSTDVSIVSQIVPVVTLNTVCQVSGAPGHHWGITACAGSDAGARGMLRAAEVMAGFAAELYRSPETVRAAKAEFAGEA